MNLVLRQIAVRNLSEAMNISLDKANSVLDAMKEEAELSHVKDILSRIAMKQEG